MNNHAIFIVELLNFLKKLSCDMLFFALVLVKKDGLLELILFWIVKKIH